MTSVDSFDKSSELWKSTHHLTASAKSTDTKARPSGEEVLCQSSSPKKLPGHIHSAPLLALCLITGSERCPYHATNKTCSGLHFFVFKVSQITGGQGDTPQTGVFTAWHRGGVQHTLEHCRGVCGSAGWRQPKLGDSAEGWCPPGEVAKSGMGSSITAFWQYEWR